MREYGQLQCAFWQSSDIQACSDSAKLLAAYLITGPHSNGLGCYRLPDGYVVADFGWTIDKVSKAFAELIERRFVERCSASGFVLMPKFLRWNPIGNPKIAAARLKELKQVPPSSLIYEAVCWCLAAFGGPHVPSDFVSAIREMGQRITARIPAQIRQLVLARDDNKCVLCSSSDDLTLDHILPRALGGTHGAENLRTLCRSCNSKRPMFDIESETKPYLEGIDTLSKQDPTRSDPKETQSDPGSHNGFDLNGQTASGHHDLHDEILAAYHEVLPDLPAVRMWTETRRRKLDARIADGVKRGKPADKPEYWRAYFAKVSRSDWLCGRAGKWKCPGLEWLVEESNFAKAVEGAYENNPHGATA